MSAFHRIDDLRSMPARRLIDFALRLPAYKGILRALIEADAHEETKTSVQGASAAPAAPASRPGYSADIRQNRTVPSDAATLLTDPALAGMFERKAPTDG
jgi:hypothetical protein